MLSTVNWIGPDGGNWDTPANWSPAGIPNSTENVVINPASAETIVHGTNQSDSVLSLTTNSNATLKITAGSLSLGAGSSTFGGPVTVVAGAKLSVAAGASVLIQGGNLTDGGILDFASDDKVSINGAIIAVNGTMSTTTNDSFTNIGGGSYIAVNSGGELAASNTTFTLALLSLDNNSKLKATDLTGDVFDTPVSLPYNDVQYLANNATFDDVEINPGTLPSDTLSLDQIGTNSSSLRYDFLSGFTVASGATIAVGPNVSVLIQGGNLTDGGILDFASGDKVSINGAIIAVNGTMSTTTNDSFTNIGGGSYIAVNSGGELAASNTTFTLALLSLDNNSKLKATDLTGDVFDTPVSLPYSDVQYLANNATFNDVEINPGTLPSGTLSLDQIGTNSSSLRYDFLSGFTVASGATIAVGPNVSVLIQGGNLTDGGILDFASGDKVSINGAIIAVNGTMSTTTNDSFTNIGGGSYIAVNSGGELAASNTTFTLALLSLDNNSKLKATDLTGDVFDTPVSLPYNDVQYLANNSTFNDVEINPGTLPSGTLSLDQIGTNSSSLRYDFLSGFTVASGATIAVGPNVSVLIQGGNLTDGGILDFASDDKVSINGAIIAVNGTMSTTTNDSFTNIGGGSYIAVNSGGEPGRQQHHLHPRPVLARQQQQAQGHRPDRRRLRHARLPALQRRPVPGQQRDLQRRRNQPGHPPQRPVANLKPDRHQLVEPPLRLPLGVHGSVGGDARRRAQRQRPDPGREPHRRRHPGLRIRRQGVD